SLSEVPSASERASLCRSGHSRCSSTRGAPKFRPLVRPKAVQAAACRDSSREGRRVSSSLFSSSEFGAREKRRSKSPLVCGRGGQFWGGIGSGAALFEGRRCSEELRTGMDPPESGNQERKP